MTRLEQQFEEDRALRDAARYVLMADLAHAQASFSGKGIANRVGSRVGDGAKDVLEVAKGHADDHRGILAALIGAVILWFARAPILELLGFGSADQSESAEVPDDVEVDPAADPDGSSATEPKPDPANTGISAEGPLGDEHE